MGIPTAIVPQRDPGIGEAGMLPAKPAPGKCVHGAGARARSGKGSRGSGLGLSGAPQPSLRGVRSLDQDFSGVSIPVSVGSGCREMK